MNQTQGAVEKCAVTFVEKQAFVKQENTKEEPRHGVKTQIEVNYQQSYGE